MEVFSMAMTADGRKDVFLSCFKCGRIVRSNETECPRCGLQFGPGTLFECPFCSGLVWRNATTCSTCGIDLTKFSENIEKTSSGFDMDQFVDSMITSEVEQIKTTVRRVSCPGCGLMIRGDETRCPRCDLPLEEAQVDCPVCGEKVPSGSKSCPTCGAYFGEEGRAKPPEPKRRKEAPEPEPEGEALKILPAKPEGARVSSKSKSSKKAPGARPKGAKKTRATTRASKK